MLDKKISDRMSLSFPGDKPKEWDSLDCSNNGIVNLSNGLFTLKFLRELNLENNKISNIPEQIIELVDLQLLNLSKNRISYVGKHIGKMTRLKVLNLAENRISGLPMELGNMYKLTVLNLDGNPLIEPYYSMYQSKGGLGVVNFCREHNSQYSEPTPRTWIDTAEKTDVGDSFTVGTFNILCNHYTTPATFGYVPSWSLQWDNRAELIMSEIQKYNLDILMLQEMETYSFLEKFKDQLEQKNNYDSIFYPKGRARGMADEEKMGVDGCATFWKKHKYSLVAQKCVEFSSVLNTDPRFKESENIIKRNINKDNIALITILERGGNQMMVVNTHIFWDPEYDDVKLFQITILLEEIQKLKRKHPNAGIILGGDFNSTRDSDAYALLTKGVLKNPTAFKNFNYDAFGEDISHSLQLSDAYCNYELELTHFTPDFRDVIDYVFFNNSFTLQGVLSAVENEYIENIIGFPTVHYPSDHILIAAKLIFKNKKKHKKPDFK